MLTANDIHVGDEIIILYRMRRGRETAMAVVTKVSRVWITAETVGAYPRELRFRLDTQTDGSDVSMPTCFRTLAQYEKSQKLSSALKVLKEHSFERRWSGNCSDALLLAVADFITEWDKEH